jgi:hypothetical protein
MSHPTQPTARPARSTALRALAAAAIGIPLIVSPAVADPESPSDDGAAPPAADAGESPVQVVTLTDDAGSPTEQALAGVDDPTSVSDSPLPTLSAPTAEDRAVADAQADGDLAILTSEIDAEDFLLAGVTWAAGAELAEDATIDVRTRVDGEWSSWSTLDPETPGADGLPGGTEPYLTTAADGVQVQVDAGSGELPADLRLTLVPEDISGALELEPDGPGPAPRSVDMPSAAATSPLTDADGATTNGSATTDGAGTARAQATSSVNAQGATGTASAPAVISREAWGANPDYFFWPPQYSQLRAAVVHHTAGSNTYTYDEAPGVVRSIYFYHAQTRGWGDIGYNFLVDRWGRVFEGREGSMDSPATQMTIGAHAAPQNTNTVGVSIMGDFSYGPAPAASMGAVRDVIAWRFALAGVDVDARTGLYSLGTSFWPAGAELPAIMGHRDVAYQTRTICPGPYVAAALPGMINDVRELVGNRFYLSNTWTTQAEVQFAFGDRGAEVIVGDWDGDGTDTVGVRRGQTIELTNGHDSTREVLLAYGRADDQIVVGDWNGDGRDTLGVRRGNILYLRNDLVSGPAQLQIAFGRANDELLVGDWNGDGRDSFGVRRGNRFLLTNRQQDGVAEIDFTYGRAGDQVIVGDWDGNGTDTFTVRRGAEYYMRNSVTDGVADRQVRFGRETDRVIAGDWDGNGTDTLGVVR